MKILKKNINKILILAIILVIAFLATNKKTKIEKNVITQIEQSIKQVKTISLEQGITDTSPIEAAGTIKANTKVDVVALTQGTLKSIYFNVGDKVYANQVIANLYSNATLSNLSNAQANFSNIQNNLNATEQITSKTVAQAEIGVKNAKVAIESAEIALKTAQNNLANIENIQKKSANDTKQNAIVAFNQYLNTISTTLDQINYILHVDTTQPQLTGIQETLGAKNFGNLINAKLNYEQANIAYNQLIKNKPNINSINNNFINLIESLAKTKKATDKTKNVLEDTVTSMSLSQDVLNTQIANFNTLSNSLISAQTTANNILHGLDNIGLTQKQEKDNLAGVVDAKQNQLNIAKISYENALNNLESAKQAKEQNLINAKTTLDGSRGQLNLAKIQTGDLRIKTPISGQITRKYIELGTEVSPGTKIAEVSQTETLKIEVNLTAQDIYKIKSGIDQIIINDEYLAELSQIAPAADPITKKIKVELKIDNKNKILIPETFAKVKITPKNIEAEKTPAEGVDIGDASYLVPLRGVIIGQNEKYVFIFDNGIARKINITTGEIKGENIIVTGNLKIGDEIIVSGNREVEDREHVVKNQ